MPTPRSIIRFFPLALWMFVMPWPIWAQKLPVPGVPGRDHVEIKRLRPADVQLANGTTIAVQVNPIDSRAAHLVGRLKKIIANGIIGANRASLREVTSSPQVMIDCSITRCEYNEKTEAKKLLMVKEKGTYKIITFMLEASYKVVRTRDSYVYFADNVTLPYKSEFQVGVQSAPGKSEIEDSLMNQVIKAILTKLSNTEETQKVRLMGKGDLSRYARLAQGGQWAEFINSISSLPKEKPNRDGLSSFEGDRHYNLSIAYEAQFYEKMWADYSSAESLFGLADTEIRDAQKFDPREKEYVNAQTRLLQGKKYFDTIRERFPRQAAMPTAIGQKRQPAGPAPRAAADKSNSVTSEDVITMLRGGVPEEIIVDKINGAKEKRFDTSAAVLVRLVQAGASPALIKMIQTAPAPAPAPTPAPRRRK